MLNWIVKISLFYQLTVYKQMTDDIGVQSQVVSYQSLNLMPPCWTLSFIS